MKTRVRRVMLDVTAPGHADEADVVLATVDHHPVTNVTMMRFRGDFEVQTAMLDIERIIQTALEAVHPLSNVD